MGDIEELKELVAQQARDIANLIAELARIREAAVVGGPAHHLPVPDAGAVSGGARVHIHSVK